MHHLDELESYIQELEGQYGKGQGGEISVGQWELHPWLTRPDIVEWCQKRGVVLEAYCPLVRGQRFDEKGLQVLAGKYGKTPAQVLVRWSLQKVGALPTMGRELELADRSAGIRAVAKVGDALEDRGKRRRVRLRVDGGGYGLAAYYGLLALLMGPDDE